MWRDGKVVVDERSTREREEERVERETPGIEDTRSVTRVECTAHVHVASNTKCFDRHTLR